MKNLFKYSFIGILGVLLLASCYRDKGNYSYRDLNEISIDLPDLVSVQQGMILDVSPGLNFALEDSEDNLSYEWVISIPTSTDSVKVVLSTERNFSERIDYSSGNSYPFSFKVTDKNTGVTYRKGMSLQVKTDYQPGYFIVEQYHDRGDISFYNTETKAVYHNLFSEVNPDIALKPNVTDLFSVDYNGYSVSIDPDTYKFAAGNLTMLFGEDWGYVIDYRSCRVISGVEQMFSTTPAVIRPQFLGMDASPNFFLMNDGKIHRMYQSQGQTLFGDAFVTADGLDYDCAPVIGLGFYYRGMVSGVLFYDELNHRFYGENYKSMIFNHVQSRYVVDKDTLIDAGKIDEDWELIGMAQGGMMNTSYFVVFKDPDNVYVAHYAITGGGFSSGPFGVAKEENCPGMRDSPVFVAPTGRSQVYYANGNEIRLYDIYANTSRAIHTFPVGENVTSIVFPTTDGLKLAAATYDGAKGSIYTFDLVNTGDLKDPTPTASETGFGYIKKMVYKK